MKIVELRTGDDLIEVTGNSADVLVDGPLVIVQNHNQPFGMVRDIVQGLIRNPASESRVAGNRHYVFFTARLVAGHSHAKRCRESRAGVPGAVAIVRAFGAQHKPVQAARHAYGVEQFAAPRQEFVHVSLVAHVEQEHIVWRPEHIVERDGKFHHTKVRAKMPAVVRKDRDQPLAYFRGQLFKFGKGMAPYLLWRINMVEYACHAV